MNHEYETLHKEFEAQFWGTKMALNTPEYHTASGGAHPEYSTEELTAAKVPSLQAHRPGEDRVLVTPTPTPTIHPPTGPHGSFSGLGG